MRHNRQSYELKFGQTTVTVRRVGSAHLVCATILGQELIPDSDMARVWVDRLVFDEETVEQDSWRAYGAISTILEVPAQLLARNVEQDDG